MLLAIWLGWNAETDRIYVAAIMSDEVYREPEGTWVASTETDGAGLPGQPSSTLSVWPISLRCM